MARTPFSGAATVAVVAAGTAAVLVGLALPPRPRPVGVRRLGVWVGIVAVTVAWQLAAYLQHPRIDHPTLSSLLNELLDSQGARAAAFLLWLAAAVRLARR